MSNESLFFLAACIDIVFVFVAARLGRDWLVSAVVFNLFLIGTFGGKLAFQFGAISNVGNTFYACVFLATYALLERYGKTVAFRTIWLGAVLMALFVTLSQIAVHYTGDIASSATNDAIASLFTFAPRIMIGSITAFVFAQYINIFVYERIGSWKSGRMLWFRINGANIIAQLADSSLFFTIAFYDLPGPLLVQAIFVGWLLKVSVVALGTPLLYLDQYFGGRKK